MWYYHQLLRFLLLREGVSMEDGSMYGTEPVGTQVAPCEFALQHHTCPNLMEIEFE